MAFRLWEARPVELPVEEGGEGYSLVSNYYEKRSIRGIVHYRITPTGKYKIKEGHLIREVHNFLCYLAGCGNKLIDEDTFENGDIR